MSRPNAAAHLKIRRLERERAGRLLDLETYALEYAATAHEGVPLQWQADATRRMQGAAIELAKAASALDRERLLG